MSDVPRDLAELLLANGYEVHGIDLPEVPLPNLQLIEDRLTLHRGSLVDTDWLGSDLIVFFGSNTPNNQPVTTK